MQRAGARALAVGVVLAVVPVLLFIGRDVGDVTADITLEPAGVTAFGADEVEARGAYVTVELDPPDAADDAHWFQATAWQGGGLVLADMAEIEPGVWRSSSPVPVEGHWKTLVRLHRSGDELMAVPIWFPPDPEIDEEEIPAIDRTVPFASESQYLLRETEEGDTPWLSPLVHGYLVVVLACWLAAFVVGVRRIGGQGADAPVRDEPLVPSG